MFASFVNKLQIVFFSHWIGSFTQTYFFIITCILFIKGINTPSYPEISVSVVNVWPRTFYSIKWWLSWVIVQLPFLIRDHYHDYYGGSLTETDTNNDVNEATLQLYG